MMMMTMTTTTTTSSSTTIGLNKPPSKICGGYMDVHGIWNNGFACPMQNLVQYLCCGTEHDHYCCPPELFLSEISNSDEQIFISGQYEPSNHIIIDQHSRSFLMNNSEIINKQFEQFQKIFLPIFLLTSSILFLIGIAIWFWLYKHKAFYAMEQDDLNEEQRIVHRSSPLIRNDLLAKKRDSINLTMDRQSRRMSYPSTEV